MITTSRHVERCSGLPLQLIPRSEKSTTPPCKTGGEEQRRHAEADGDADVGDAVEAPAEAADQVDDRIEQGDGLPDRRQDLDGVEAAAWGRLIEVQFAE
jgi:hypothetical protein